MKAAKIFLLILLLVVAGWLLRKTSDHRSEVLRLSARQDSINRRSVEGSINSIRKQDSLRASQETVFR
ncbi:hypothetical protein GO755_25995 [Spirosoma sp. HMF4905]|uniref:Uncharacterized protein n=1 Tax=Spirosoma arboris TaxID=2682092 RepID=A0A7K1SIX1_9BACT|nr:hypothetical protein [Spirosoma arboris]MVM33516.1 hypothetical protein [Spirosoma arboris]